MVEPKDDEAARKARAASIHRKIEKLKKKHDDRGSDSDEHDQPKSPRELTDEAAEKNRKRNLNGDKSSS